jgi:hypothetical protein
MDPIATAKAVFPQKIIGPTVSDNVSMEQSRRICWMNVVDTLLVYGISVKKFTRTADTIIKKMHRQIAYSDDRKHKLYCIITVSSAHQR